MSANQKMWTAEELVRLKTLWQKECTWLEIAAKLGRSVESCKMKWRTVPPLERYILASPEEAVLLPDGIVEQPKTVEDDKVRAGNDFWRREYKTLEGKYEKILKEQSAIEQLVGLAAELAPKSYEPAPAVRSVNEKIGGGSSPQSAVLLLSDTHIGQVVEPDQTLGFGRYDFPTFLSRLKYLEESVASILQDHTTTRVDELVICLGGDLIDGALDHGAEAGQKNTLFTQFYAGSHALAQFLRNVAALAPRVRVYCTVGNHPRWQNQKRMPTTNRYSNLDLFLYAHIQALTREITHIEWTLDAQPFALFYVQGFVFHLSHGDHLKGGDRALGIPNHSVGRMISSTTQLFGKTGAPAPHYYLVGHLHRSIVLPHARGSVVINGGFAGLDGYGLASGFSPVDPSQVFFLVHPKYGKTATYDIWLKNAVETEQPPYDIPNSFPAV